MEGLEGVATLHLSIALADPARRQLILNECFYINQFRLVLLQTVIQRDSVAAHCEQRIGKN